MEEMKSATREEGIDTFWDFMATNILESTKQVVCESKGKIFTQKATRWWSKVQEVIKDQRKKVQTLAKE